MISVLSWFVWHYLYLVYFVHFVYFVYFVYFPIYSFSLALLVGIIYFICFVRSPTVQYMAVTGFARLLRLHCAHQQQHRAAAALAVEVFLNWIQSSNWIETSNRTESPNWMGFLYTKYINIYNYIYIVIYNLVYKVYKYIDI